MVSEAVFSSFLLVAASEMGDKTQLLAFSLAARYKKPMPIMAGILVATTLNHLLASFVGQWISGMIPTEVLGVVLAITFIGFGIWTLKPDTLEQPSNPQNYGIFLTTAGLFFLAEMGDKTQLATIALGAKYQSTVAVTVGTTLGMLVTDGLAVFLGDKITSKIDMKWIRLTAAILFFVFGIISLISVI